MASKSMRRVLVTGGGTGIGRAIARAFADAGDHVTICGRRLAPLEETAEGFDMVLKQADVTDEASIAALFTDRYDVVVANAGIARNAKLTKLSLQDWNDTLNVTLTGVFLTFRAALPQLESGGRLIAIASTASLQGGADTSGLFSRQARRAGAWCALLPKKSRSQVSPATQFAPVSSIPKWPKGPLRVSHKSSVPAKTKRWR